jgi:hypothetical protein
MAEGDTRAQSSAFLYPIRAKTLPSRTNSMRRWNGYPSGLRELNSALRCGSFVIKPARMANRGGAQLRGRPARDRESPLDAIDSGSWVTASTRQSSQTSRSATQTTR